MSDAKTIFLQVVATNEIRDEEVIDEREMKVRSQSHFKDIFISTYGNFPVFVGKDSKKIEITTFDDLSGGETYRIVSWKLDAKIIHLQNVDWRRATDFEKAAGVHCQFSVKPF